MLKFLSVLLLPLCFLACDNIQQKQDDDADRHTLKPHHLLKNCFAFEKGGIAEIVVEEVEAHTFAMRMKEPDGSWDMPEPMESLAEEKAWEFYKGNGLGLNSSDIYATVARTDGVMAISVLKSEIMTVKTHLDSNFVVSLFGATNTIYAVPCDDKPLVLDAVANPHAK